MLPRFGSWFLGSCPWSLGASYWPIKIDQHASAANLIPVLIWIMVLMCLFFISTVFLRGVLKGTLK